jgi:hypothetical protein
VTQARAAVYLQALNADSLKVGGSMFCGDGLAATGEVSQLGAHIGGQLSCSGGGSPTSAGWRMDLTDGGLPAPKGRRNHPRTGPQLPRGLHAHATADLVIPSVISANGPASFPSRTQHGGQRVTRSPDDPSPLSLSAASSESSNDNGPDDPLTPAR